MSLETTRNFTIIAHIDHGKSTLADRMLELTHTLSDRDMHDRVLDDMELEQERGITIKMRPVSMQLEHNNTAYTLNLIDTPGHVDFRYEVSRALKAVEGSLLLVDATQGIQAQTLTTLSMARESGLVVIPVLTKIDSPLAQIDDVKLEIAEMLDCDLDSILQVSGKTGEGVADLLEQVIKQVPAPKPVLETPDFRALVFDFEYEPHKGIIVYVRITDGSLSTKDTISLVATNQKCTAIEIGTFTPKRKPRSELSVGDIGYIVTGLKEAGIAKVGDTVIGHQKNTPALDGYAEPAPVVWASMYPESPDDFPLLGTALGRLRLSDSSYTYEEEASGTLGRGYRVGCLGMLHLEIITERLRREFSLELIITSPSVTYHITTKNDEHIIVYSPSLFPDHGSIASIEEPWVDVRIMSPGEYVGDISQLLYTHEAETGNTEQFGDGRIVLHATMPIRELMRGFFDSLKSVSSGYASLSYEDAGMREADVVRLDVLVAGDVVPAFTRIISRKRIQEEAEAVVEKLHTILPRQMFVIKIQAQALGRIWSSQTVKAFRKDVTAKLYGGDITRKMKLREKQKKGKKKMADRSNVHIGQDVFLKMMKS